MATGAAVARLHAHLLGKGPHHATARLLCDRTCLFRSSLSLCPAYYLLSHFDGTLSELFKMRFSALKIVLALLLSACSVSSDPLPANFALPRRQLSTSNLWVSEVPTSPRPYAVRHYGIPALQLGSQVYRFPVTGPSSDGAFSLLSTAAPASGSLGVLPHTHLTHYENFFCLKGRFQLWTADAATYSNEEARLLTPGDYGAVPHNTTHTFQVLDP